MARYSPRGNIDGKFNDNVPDVAEQASDESRQGTKDNNQLNTTPGKEILFENRLFLRNKSRKRLTHLTPFDMFLKLKESSSMFKPNVSQILEIYQANVAT